MEAVCSIVYMQENKRHMLDGKDARTQKRTPHIVPGSIVPVGGLATFVIGIGKGFTISTSCLKVVYGGCRCTAPTLLLVPN